MWKVLLPISQHYINYWREEFKIWETQNIDLQSFAITWDHRTVIHQIVILLFLYQLTSVFFADSKPKELLNHISSR